MCQSHLSDVHARFHTTLAVSVCVELMLVNRVTMNAGNEFLLKIDLQLRMFNVQNHRLN